MKNYTYLEAREAIVFRLTPRQAAIAIEGLDALYAVKPKAGSCGPIPRFTEAQVMGLVEQGRKAKA